MGKCSSPLFNLLTTIVKQKIKNKMKTAIHYSIILATSLVLIISSFSCTQQKEKIPALLERSISKTADADRVQIVKVYGDAKEAITKNPGDLQQYINLASAFIAEGRITGNTGYYNNAALQMLAEVTNSQTANRDITFQALTLQSSVLLNYHQFKDALAAAEKGVAINNYNSGIYGALVDANVELGNYEKAVEYCDKMVSLRPDLRSYSRVSYLRQLYGQNKGAIQAMTMAVEAGVPGSENTEWARTTLGDLYLTNGNPDSASIIYRTALIYRPSYPYALIGLAKVAKVKRDYNAAIARTEEAIRLLPDASFVALLADLHELNGNEKKASEVRADVVSIIEEGVDQEPKLALAKHNVSRELATAYMHNGNLEQALRYAKKDLEMRPTNIDANSLVAWIYYLKGDYAAARMHIDKAFVTNIQSAELFYKAARIYAKAGIQERSNELMENATTINAHVQDYYGNPTKYAAALHNRKL